MTQSTSLFTASGQRKYLNMDERARFLAASQALNRTERLFCHVLFWSGARPSEALALTVDQVMAFEGVLVFRSLKKKDLLHHRQVPVPKELVEDLSKLNTPEFPSSMFPWGRTWGWDIVKRTMMVAQISGPQACPRGLRHSFAVHAVASGVPLHLIQRWLGHARLETTAIYLQTLGPDERLIAQRMWER